MFRNGSLWLLIPNVVVDLQDLSAKRFQSSSCSPSVVASLISSEPPEVEGAQCCTDVPARSVFLKPVLGSAIHRQG